MKKKLIVANWKMNSGFEESDAWVADFTAKIKAKKNFVADFEAVICPPYLLIDNMSANAMDYVFEELETELAKKGISPDKLGEDKMSEMILSKKILSVGAQNCHHEEKGAFTGEVSAKMLIGAGCQYIIIGHSERRVFESDELVKKKLVAISKQNITPILCVGESKEIRDKKTYLEFIKSQLVNSIDKGLKFKKFVIAYEPIWSIGTGLVPSSEQISEVIDFINEFCKKELKGLAEEFYVLYGGSVSKKNSAEILSIKNVDGVLVGGASLKGEEFFEICIS